MILDQLSMLHESAVTFDCEPIVKPCYTPDLTGIMAIHNESMEQMYQLEENMMLAEQLVLGYEVKGLSENAIQLQEGAVGDFFSKVVKFLEDTWKKLKGFFVNLFESIGMAVRDITKTIEKHKKDLDKDFSDFEYKGYKWSANKHSEYGNRASSMLTELQGKVSKAASDASSDRISKGAFADKADDAAKKAHESNTKEYSKTNTKDNYIANIVKGDVSKEMTVSEAKSEISEQVKGEGIETIKGFEHTGVNQMVEFIKKFKDNKVLREAQKKVDELYSKAIKEAKKVRDTVTSTQNNAGEGTKGKYYAGSQLAIIKSAISNMQSSVSAYDSVMGICIDLEKERFNEYKKVIIAAIKHRPKKA